ncbi:MAG: hypothetical protein MZW92_50950 [Comamonadaceae bacterium]|nr:hypothetical protein [Comamonadaceae bacterium]
MREVLDRHGACERRQLHCGRQIDRRQKLADVAHLYRRLGVETGSRVGERGTAATDQGQERIAAAGREGGGVLGQQGIGTGTVTAVAV